MRFLYVAPLLFGTVLGTILMSSTSACAQVADAQNNPGEPAPTLFDQASALATEGKLADSFHTLERALDAGYETPSDVLWSQGFQSLLDDPDWRAQVRDLLKTHARESRLRMFPNDEPGERMILTVHIVGGHREPPVAVDPLILRSGVLVGFVQTGADGHYGLPAEKDWNPRHFAFGLTDERGTIVVESIRPGYYAPEFDIGEPAHMHYNVEVRGTLLRASEFFFDDDPRLAGDALKTAQENRVPIASIVRGKDGVWRGEVTIPVRGLR